MGEGGAVIGLATRRERPTPSRPRAPSRHPAALPIADSTSLRAAGMTPRSSFPNLVQINREELRRKHRGAMRLSADGPRL